MLKNNKITIYDPKLDKYYSHEEFNEFDREAILQVMPEYYQEIKPKIENFRKEVAEIRNKKDIAETRHSEFGKDIENIRSNCYGAVTSFFKGSKNMAQKMLENSFKAIDERHLEEHYQENKFERQVIEKLMIEARMMYNAINMCKN